MTENYLTVDAEVAELNRESHLPDLISKLRPQDAKIMKYFMGYDWIEKPDSLAKKLNENPNSIRSRLSALHKAGYLGRKDGGYYYLSSTYGVLVRRFNAPFRVQNVRCRARGVVGVVGEVVEWVVGSVRVVLTFGGSTGNVSYTVGVGNGLGLVSLDFVHDWVKRRCVDRGLVIPEDSWEFMCEFFTDYYGVSLGGIGYVCLTSFLGFYEKLYQKPRLRLEVGSTGERGAVGWEVMRAMMGRGVEAGAIHYELRELRRESDERLNRMENNVSEICLNVGRIGKELGDLQRKLGFEPFDWGDS